MCYLFFFVCVIYLCVWLFVYLLVFALFVHLHMCIVLFACLFIFFLCVQFTSTSTHKHGSHLKSLRFEMYERGATFGLMN